MPSSPVSSPRFPQYEGFQPLPPQTADSSRTRMDPDAAGVGIPLAQMRSNGSRRANQGGVGPEIERMRSAAGGGGGDGGPLGTTSSGTTDEKRGLFKRNKPVGRRRNPNRDPEPVKRQTTDSEIALNFMGRLYSRLVEASVLTRYVIYVLPVAFLLAIPLVLLPVTGNANTIPLGSVTTNSTVNPPIKAYGPPLFHLFIWFEASWAGLWAAKIVAHLLPVVFVFFCGVISSGTRKYATVLRGLEIPLSLFFWALETWLVFRFLFADHRIGWIYAVTNVLGSLFVSSAVFLGERAIIHLMSISYHQRSFANRIKESKRDIYLLGLMYDASRALFPMYCSEFAEEDYIINDSIEAMINSRIGGSGEGNGVRSGGAARRLRRGSGVGGVVQPMRIIGNVGRFGDKVTSVFGNLASEITGKQVFNPNSAHSIVVEALEKTRSSEALARRIWMSFVVEDNDALYPQDIAEVLGPTHKEEAEECFVAIDADSNGDISLDEMIRKVVQIGKERKAMANSMKDISEALAAFDSVLLFIVLLVVVFIFLAFFQSSFITTLATAGTALLSLSFVFAVTTQEILGSCIFLFVKHPYDVGDRVDITGPEKEMLTVEKISLLYTVFTRIDKMQVVQVPNIALNALWIENVTRSKAMRETIEFNVSYDTSFEDIELLRLEMEAFVRHPDNSRDFQPDLSVSVAGVGDLDKLQLKVAIKHKSNWHNDQVRATRRSKFMCALALALKKVPIYGPGGGSDPLGAPANPAYSVTVTDEKAAAARAQAAREKNRKRLMPQPEDDSDDHDDGASPAGRSRSSSTEKEATRTLNTNNPLADADDFTLNNGSRDSSAERGGGGARAAGGSSSRGQAGDSGGAGYDLTTTGTSSSYLHPSSSVTQRATGSSGVRTRNRAVSSASRGTNRSRAGYDGAGADTSADVEALMRNELLKSQSQKGRRQAGQGLPPMTLGGENGPQMGTAAVASPSSPVASMQYGAMPMTSRRDIDAVDLERGSLDVVPSNPSSNPSNNPFRAAASAAGGKSSALPHPLQSAPTQSSGGSRYQPQ